MRARQSSRLPARKGNRMADETQTDAAGSSQSAESCLSAGRRALENGDFPGAIENARTALRLAPALGAARLLLADALSEVHQYDEALRWLFTVAGTEKELEPECTFLLGSILISCGDYAGAQNAFKDYLHLAPRGPHASKVREMLAFLGAEQDGALGFFTDASEHEAQLQVVQAVRHMDSGRFDRACQILQAVPASQAGTPYVRNNLAMACYGLGQTDKALELTRQVLANEPENVPAICNMATFLSGSGRAEEAVPYLDLLDSISPGSDEKRFQIAALFCELGQHDRAYRHMHAYNSLCQRNVQSLFSEAVAACNTGRGTQAVQLLTEVRRIEESRIVADYYLQLLNQALRDDAPLPQLSYVYALPSEETLRLHSRLNEYLRLDNTDLYSRWQDDADFEQLLLWMVKHGDENVRLACLALIQGFGDRKAEEMLRGFLLMRTLPDTLKQEIGAHLAAMDVTGPLPVSLGGELNMVAWEDGGSSAAPDPDRAAELAREVAVQLERPDAGEGAAALLRQSAGRAALREPAASAAAALWVAAGSAGTPLSLEETARQCGAPLAEVQNCIDAILS